MAGQDNQVELVGFYGSDLTHALSAWTSTARDLTEDKKARVGKMLATLASEGHHSPFEKSTLHFLATTDIATHVQILKHRIGVSVNGESARYKELKDDKFYLPQDWDEEELGLYIAHMEESLARYHACLSRLVSKGMTRKRAKETARFYLPYGNQITVDISFNFRSFAHFVGLRYTSHAQVEICRLTGKMLTIVRDLGAFPRTLEAFGFVDESGNIAAPL